MNLESIRCKNRMFFPRFALKAALGFDYICSYVLKGCGFDHKSCLAELVDDSLRACQVAGSEDKQQREALHYHPVLRTPLLPRKRGLRWVWLPSTRRGRGRPPPKKDGRPRANRKGMLWPAGGRRRWSWWESNPRPNKEIIRFLHAYSRLHFRATARPGPPTGALSSKTSSLRRGPQRLFPIFLRRRFLRFGTTSLGRRLVPSPSEGIKLVIYCASIKQREHTVCCQLFC